MQGEQRRVRRRVPAMSAFTARTVAHFASVVIAAACVACGQPRFVEPSPSEPHAIVKIRVVYHKRPGPSLRETITLDKFQIVQEAAERQIDYPFTRALRVPPRPTRWAVNATFYHSTTRQVQHQVAERYACGTTTTGSGVNMRSTTNYCTRYRTETRSETVNVDDAVCSEIVNQVVREGAAYLLQYDFYEEGKCTLTCSEQTSAGNGSVALTPCKEPTAETN